MINPFFKNHGPFSIFEIIKLLKINLLTNHKEEVKDINDLVSANVNDITFFHSKKYKNLANKTKASYCITTSALINDLPKSCVPLIVDNVLVSTSTVTEKFYPDAVNDNFDNSIAFKTACDLGFKGKEQPSGYTEPLLHLNRLSKKSNLN